MTERFQIHLFGRGHSGRAVRYKILDVDVLDKIEVSTAMLPEVQAGISVIGWNQLVAKEGVDLMIESFTDPIAPKDLPELAPSKWTKASPEMFQDGHLQDYFTVRDIRLLRDLYMREHEIGKTEVDSLLAGKVPIED